MPTLQELKNKVEKRISDYIQFDVNEIFKVSDYITIYGGAVRDSIADKDINDVDILCMPDSAKKLKDFLLKYDYTPLDLYDEDALNMYHGISLISEPWTLINNNKRIIQIIRPRFYTNKMSTYTQEYINAYYNLIKNVDFSCCGVFFEYDGNETILKESCKNGISHCLAKTFETNEWATLYNHNRTLFREHKLESRGWYNLKNKNGWYENEYNRVERALKIIQLEFNQKNKNEDYKIWSEEEYIDRIKYKKQQEENSSLPF